MPGSSLPDQVKHYVEFCGYRKEGEISGLIDLTDCTFIHPTTLLPLTSSLAKYGWDLKLNPKTSVGGYLSFILGRQKKPYGRSFVAPVMLPKSQEDCESVLEAVYTLESENDWFNQNIGAFKYVVAELVDNIYQHSAFDYAYIMAQRYSLRRLIELCFYDDGIGIPGSFGNAGKKYTRKSHYLAIYEAMKGVSTKSGTGRGYGLSSNVEMFRDVGGEVLIVSGFGAIYLNKDRIIPYRLRTYLNTSLMSMRLQAMWMNPMNALASLSYLLSILLNDLTQLKNRSTL